MTHEDHSGRAISRRGLLGLAGLVGGVTASGVFVPDLFAIGEPQPAANMNPLAGPTLPKVLSCAGWQAREPSGPIPELPARPVKIIVHHTATRNRSGSEALSLEDLARGIQNWHMDKNGWPDSGQHFTINRTGLIAEGRHRSLETLLAGRHLIEGSHCREQNRNSIGIENEGTYTTVNPPSGQLATLRVLCAYVCLQYRISPREIYGHRDFGDTECPGDRLWAWLPTLRGGVARLLGRAGPVPKPPPGRRPAEGDLPDPYLKSPPTWPLLRTADRGPVVQAAQHLLRAAGQIGVPADGAYGPATATGVSGFQLQRGLDVTGMIGGASWPLLAVPVRRGQGGEAEQAVQVLVRSGPGATEAVPDVIERDTWQRLLGTG